MSTAIVPVTATLGKQELERLLRGKSPLAAAGFMRSQTLHPDPRRIDHHVYRVPSFTSSRIWVTDTDNETCTCPSRARRCRHWWYCRLFEEHGPYLFGIRWREMNRHLDRYERNTGVSAVSTLPPEELDFEQFRAWKAERSA